MAKFGQAIIFISLVIPAVIYQYYLKEVLIVSLGYGRPIQSLREFPYTCRAVRHPDLEGCEDMWLDDKDRALYAACSNSYSHSQWYPPVEKFNVSAHSIGDDHISVLNIDTPGDDGLYGLRRLVTSGYVGSTGDASLTLHGFDVEVLDGARLRFWMVNHQPPISDEHGRKQFLDAERYGANSTVEVFDVIRGDDQLLWVKTINDEAIVTPNKIAVTEDGGFLVTNDHSAKIGLRRKFELFNGGGNIAHCSSASLCHTIATSGFNYPNGMIRGADGLYYIPSSFIDNIRVMRLTDQLDLEEVHSIYVGMPVDNLSVDQAGDIYAAGLPKVLDLLAAFENPLRLRSPSTIWRIRRIKMTLDYEVTKVLEDREASYINGATVARHDVKTGRLFIGGPTVPWITVCDPSTGETSQ
ncbi:MAG: hypothetical protein Q9190_000830 [Brigantiaea leucoxantha]